ncbi:hypothetical protein Hanom_Chr12g01108961 [Helianthus anomalus]
MGLNILNLWNSGLNILHRNSVYRMCKMGSVLHTRSMNILGIVHSALSVLRSWTRVSDNWSTVLTPTLPSKMTKPITLIALDFFTYPTHLQIPMQSWKLSTSSFIKLACSNTQQCKMSISSRLVGSKCWRSFSSKDKLP